MSVKVTPQVCGTFPYKRKLRGLNSTASLSNCSKNSSGNSVCLYNNVDQFYDFAVMHDFHAEPVWQSFHEEFYNLN